MDYKHPEIRGVKRILFGNPLDKAGQKAAHILLLSLVKRIKKQLKPYLVKEKIQLLSIENSLGDLRNPPLTMALHEIVKELKIPVEVYSRVVGYFRPINQWNNGKKEEFCQRRVYKTDSLFDSPVYEYQRNS